MDASISALIVGACLLTGSAVGIAEKANNGTHYNNFINNPDNYYLVDQAGNPVSQEIK